MRVVYHYKRTPLALAPDALSDAINKFSDRWNSVVITDPKDLPTDGSLVHFHNQFVEYDGPKLIQYHSEPENRGCMPPSRFKDDRQLPQYRLTLLQYHCQLEEYAGCKTVRNVVDWTLPEYDYRPPEKPRRVGYSPSTLFRINQWYDKGYEETKKVLDYSGCDYDIVSGALFPECLQRKSVCGILIDECVTGSYHRCTLEALALGRICVCNLDMTLADTIEDEIGSALPVFNARMCNLKNAIAYLVNSEPEWIIEQGRKNRNWMELYWHPDDIVSEYLQHYETVLSA